MNKPLIGVFGSAFDPPTLGHLDVIKQFANRFDSILLVPSARHAFNKQSLGFTVRVEMLNQFVGSVKVDCDLEICEFEAELLKNNPDSPVYTFDLLVALDNKYWGQADLAFIRGPDNAHPETWNRFYRAQEIERRWTVVTAEERLDVRSSVVRAMLNEADNNIQSLDAFLLPSVSAYIQKHKLYQA